MDMKKYRVKIKEIIEHTFEVEEINEYMAEESARKLLGVQQERRVNTFSNSVFVEEITSHKGEKEKVK